MAPRFGTSRARHLLFPILLCIFLAALLSVASSVNANLDLLTRTPDWSYEGNQVEVRINSGIPLGDVNGDGFNDFALGSNRYNGIFGSNVGAVFVFFGSATGPGQSPDQVIEGTQQGDPGFGSQMLKGGDFNGDGYSDLAVGSPRYTNDQYQEGRVFVYYGSAIGLSEVPDWFAEGNQADAWFGNRATTAGDVNADGYDDLIVGAAFYDGGQTDEGAAFLYLGSANGLGSSPDWVTEGNQNGARYGSTLGTAGDVNGDGYDDVVVAAWWYDNGQTDEGRVYVYYGSPTGLSPMGDWIVESDQVNGWLGFGASAGDVNGDGFADLVIGSVRFWASTYYGGSFSVYHGSPSGLGSVPAWYIDNMGFGANIGGLAFGGDVTGDGFSDLVIGSRYFSNGQFNEGAIIVYEGTKLGLKSNPSAVIESNQVEAGLGNYVAALEDVNGDGIGDFLGVAGQFDNGHINEGLGVLYYGSTHFDIVSGSRFVDAILYEPYLAYLSASGGEAPYTWELASGELPTGLDLNPSGSISGTPQSIGQLEFVLRATDSAGSSVIKAFELEVVYPPLEIITPSPLPAGAIGVFYSTDIEAVGGVPPYSWSVVEGALPPGLTLNEDTGEISGTPTVAGTFSFTIQVADSVGQVASGPFAVSPPPASGTAGSSYSQPISVVGETGGGTETCSNYAVVSGALPPGLFLDSNTGVVSGTPTDGGSYDFTIACETYPGQTTTGQFTITIENPLPVLTGLSPAFTEAGSSDIVVTLHGSNFVESSVARWNGNDQPTDYITASELQMTINSVDLASSGMFPVTVFNPDPVGGESNVLMFEVIPPNFPPTIRANTDVVAVPEGTAAENIGEFEDLNSEDSVIVSASIGSIAQDAGSSGAWVWTFATTDGPAESQTVVIIADDRQGGVATTRFELVVANVAPTVTSVSVPIAPVEVNAPVRASATFSDPAGGDDVPFACNVDYGDGTIQRQGEVLGNSCFGADHSYSEPGIYSVQVTVTDKDGASNTRSAETYIVVYDPDGGFVTGGGWYASPEGAYQPEPALTGRANFGFVSKYSRGTSTPTGNTEFQFKAGRLNFHSDLYEWLVVNQGGTNAQFKGLGTINGEMAPNGEPYKFMVWAKDGDPNYGDTFRIRIWYETESGDEIDLYDNGGAQTIEGGKIQIHE